jgi:hypothetical protein
VRIKLLSVIEYLESLNRKERFFLVGMALGNPKFRLDTQFRQRLESQFKLTIPEDAFVAMDYHLNWIYAACELSFGERNQTRVYKNQGIVDGTQEDVDLLVAYQEPSRKCHLIMLEAKGVTAFSSGQFKHKVERFENIFEKNGKRWGDDVIPHFGLVSPKKSKNLDTKICPEWLRVNGEVPWFEMKIPDGRLVVLGCDQEGNPNQARRFWTVRG